MNIMMDVKSMVKIQEGFYKWLYDGILNRTF